MKKTKKKLEDFLDANDDSGLADFLAEEINGQSAQDKLKENGYLVSGLALAYMQTMNRINNQYKKLLEEALDTVSDIDKESGEIKDGLKMAEIKAGL